MERLAIRRSWCVSFAGVWFLPLALLAATLMLWLRSHYVSDSLQWTSDAGRTVAVGTCPGTLSITTTRVLPQRVAEMTSDGWTIGRTPPGWRYRRDPASPPSPPLGVPDREWRLAGLHYWAGRVLFVYGRSLDVALWLPAMGLLVLLAIASARRLQRADRSKTPRCAQCCYDLRATPSRCPECGAPCKPAIRGLSAPTPPAFNACSERQSSRRCCH